MKYRFNFKNFFSVDKTWKENFQIKQFFPESEKWKLSTVFAPADVTFFSVFGDRAQIVRDKSRVKIFWTGEDISVNHVAYADNCINDCDLSIGFTPENIVNSSNYIRYPLWLLYYFGQYKTLADIQKSVDEFNDNWIKSVTKKKKFCCLVASHDSFGTRKKLYDLLNQYENVLAGGGLFHNDDSLKNEFGDNKHKYLEQFMFNLCPENVSVPGYTTEKVFQSFAAGCIPVYYGSNSLVEPDVVDNSKIIFYDGKNGDSVLAKVKDLSENKEKYTEYMSTPPLKSSAAQWIYERNIKLQNMLAEVIL